jgi:hypothetical protein
MLLDEYFLFGLPSLARIELVGVFQWIMIYLILLV